MFQRSQQLLLNRFVEASTPSMIKGCDGENILFRGFICCSGVLYAVQGGYMDVQGGYMLFRGVICGK